MGAMPTLVVGMLVLELAEHAQVNVGVAPRNRRRGSASPPVRISRGATAQDLFDCDENNAAVEPIGSTIRLICGLVRKRIG